MIKRQADPAQLKGQDLENWYRRSPEEIEAERQSRKQAEHDAFYSLEGLPESEAWEEAFYRDAAAPRPAPIPSPIRDRARPAGPSDGMPPPPGARGSFFGTHSIDYPNPTVPAPLDRVERSLGGTKPFLLSDGTFADAQEIEKIYAEQLRRARGEDDDYEPAGWVRTEDKLRDGSIPRADQLAKGQRERDATCHPNGGWERDPHFKRYSERARQYEKQVTRAEGLDYVVRVPGQKPVKFDGCAVWDPRHPLLEAKGPGYEALVDVAKKYGFYRSVSNGPIGQSHRQTTAAQGRPIDWHYAESGAGEFFRATVGPRPPITLRHTPAR